MTNTHPDATRPEAVAEHLWAKLTPLQRRYVAIRAAEPTITQGEAAAKAGVSPKRAKTGGASALEAMPAVREAIAALTAVALERAEIDAEWVVRKAVDVVDGAMDDREWNAAKATLELLAKMRGGLTDRMQVNFRDVSTMTDAELEAEAKLLGLSP